MQILFTIGFISAIYKTPQELNSLERLEKTDKIKAFQKTRKRIETGKKTWELYGELDAWYRYPITFRFAKE